jgi:hypothetical protein
VKTDEESTIVDIFGSEAMKEGAQQKNEGPGVKEEETGSE